MWQGRRGAWAFACGRIELPLPDDASAIQVVLSRSGVVEIEVCRDVATVAVRKGSHKRLSGILGRQAPLHFERRMAFVVARHELTVVRERRRMHRKPIENARGTIVLHELEERQLAVGVVLIAGPFCFGILQVSRERALRAAPFDLFLADENVAGAQTFVCRVDGFDHAGDHRGEERFAKAPRTGQSWQIRLGGRFRPRPAPRSDRPRRQVPDRR